MYNSFKLGKIDLITTNNIGIENYIGTIGYNKAETNGREFDFLAINTQNQVLANKEVRQAISRAINRESIISQVYGGKYRTQDYFLDYGNWLQGDKADTSYNTDTAIQILEDNGWEYKYNRWQQYINYSTKIINFKLVVQASNETRVAIADIIKSNLEEAGIKVIAVIPNVKLAKRVAAAGADAMVAEGMEAGGHIGVLTTMALMTQVIPEIKDIPVVMAGGFGDGRGLAAAMLMGAGGVQMGTRFLVAEECSVHENMKQKLIEAVDTDTIVTGLTLGGAVRGIKNKFSTEFVQKENEGKTSKEELIRMATGTNKLAAVEGDVVNGMMQAGQSLTVLQKVEPVATIIEDIMKQARETLSAAATIKL